MGGERLGDGNTAEQVTPRSGPLPNPTLHLWLCSWGQVLFCTLAPLLVLPGLRETTALRFKQVLKNAARSYLQSRHNFLSSSPLESS